LLDRGSIMAAAIITTPPVILAALAAHKYMVYLS
jgi:ABC-type glycerol-3-phosphate transport system permease component